MARIKRPSPSLLGSVPYLPLRTPKERTPSDISDLEGDPVEEWAILQTERDQATMAANELAYQQGVYDLADKCAEQEQALEALLGGRILK